MAQDTSRYLIGYRSRICGKPEPMDALGSAGWREADEQLSTDSNPYRSPTDPQPGEYDHSLFFRLVKIGCGFVLFFAILDAALWQSYRPAAVRDVGQVQAVVEFFRDWRRSKPLQQPAD